MAFTRLKFISFNASRMHSSVTTTPTMFIQYDVVASPANRPGVSQPAS